MTAPRAIIIGAMPDELAPFLERATDLGEPVSVGNSEQRSATLGGHEVLFVKSGIGLVNAASATVAALLGPGSSAPIVLSVGSAGGLGANVSVGDVVVGSEYINVDADATAFGYVLGQVPRMPASYTARQAELELVGNSGAAAALRARDATSQLHVGLTVSSYSFVSPERATRILGNFPASLATDMESVAIAQVSFSYERSFMSVRGISDLCGPAASTDFRTHVDDAAARSADVVAALLDSLVASLKS